MSLILVLLTKKIASMGLVEKSIVKNSPSPYKAFTISSAVESEIFSVRALKNFEDERTLFLM